MVTTSHSAQLLADLTTPCLRYQARASASQGFVVGGEPTTQFVAKHLNAFDLNYAARMEVRRANPDDADQIATIHVRSWEAAYRGLVPEAWFAERTLQRRTTMWRELLRETERTRVFVACRDGTLVGFCGAVAPSRDEDAGERTAEIAALYVDPEHWRAGAGRALITTTLDDLAGSLWRDVTLWVFEANDRGRGFYVSLGFELDGGRIQRSGEPRELRLRRQLPVDNPLLRTRRQRATARLPHSGRADLG